MTIKPAGYSGTPLARKLGITANRRVVAKHAPADYVQLLEPIPAGVLFEADVSQATDITEDTIRELALPLGFVDVKVCAVSETWSGLKLVIRKELR
jgi:hypothetical protein